MSCTAGMLNSVEQFGAVLEPCHALVELGTAVSSSSTNHTNIWEVNDAVACVAIGSLAVKVN